MTLWQAITWDTVRAGGLTAYVILTLSVIMGLALSMQLQSPSKWPRLINNELHNFLTLLVLIFVIIHVLAAWIDPFTHFGLNEVLIPLASHYRPIWMAAGIIALYLGLAIGLSTWVRPLIGYSWWRRLHVFTLLIYVLATIHGIASGNDTQSLWTMGIYIFSITLVGGFLVRRLLVPATARGRAHPALATITGIVILGIVLWAALGPFQASWQAGSVQAATSTSSSAASNNNKNNPGGTQQQNDPFAAPFTASMQGQVTQSQAGTNGQETIRMDTTLSDGAQGAITIVLQGQPGNDGLTITSTQVTLGQNSNTPLYQGTLTSIRGERRINMTALLSKLGDQSATNAHQLQLQMQLRISGTQVSGSVQSTPATQGTQQNPQQETI